MFGEGVILCILFTWCTVSVKSEDGFFYGGSISYKLEEIAGKKIAHVELITGWTLGKGPCGENCSKTDVNTMTNAKRLQKELSVGYPTYFGNFSTDYQKDATTIERDLNAIVRANYSEWVIAVSEQAKWEQELMKFSFDMVDASEDIRFDGNFWRPLMNKNDQPWHFQTKVVHSLRSDTQRMNNCPQVLTKTFYRVKLNKFSTIQIPMIDPDGDVVRCSLSKWGEVGNLQQSPGVTAQTKSETSFCTVSIAANASLGYHDDVWIAVAITFRDYSTSRIKFGEDHYEAGYFSLSASSAQFVVQILENLVTPEFVPPTFKADHMFIVYVGSTWTADIYAQAPINTTIDEFITSSRNGEHITVSKINIDTSRERVKFITMSWTPTQEDTGQHILCIRAVDNTGVDTDELRCFTIDVKADTFSHSSSTLSGKPYFIDIPSIDQLVNCKVGATCLIPVFVKSYTKLSTVRITESYLDEASLGKIDIDTIKGKSVYKVILSFTHSMPGTEKICLSATDMNNATSETICITSEIEAQDACLSAPCRNGASCRSDKRTGTFICECLTNEYYGTFCEKRSSPCSKNPCTAGQTQQCFEITPPFYCYCKKGFTGKLCETNVYDCKHDSCNATTGTCRDLVNNFTCDCYQRYSGTDCTIDNCPSEGPHVLRCPAAGCSPNTCSGHGVCSRGGVCICRRGYSADPKCSNRTETYPGSRNIQFVPPTPMDKSRYTCIIKSNTMNPCYLSVFVATSSGKKPTLSMETTRELDVNSTLGNVEASDVLQGFSNIFSADIVIRGTVKKLNEHYVCVTATDGSSEADLCLELEFESDHVRRIICNGNNASVRSLTNSCGRKYKSIATLDSLQNNASIKFVEPTQIEGSRLVGFVTETYTVILYTSYSSKCEDVISTSEGVTVFPAVYDGKGKCVTEASFVMNKVGEFDICFQSAKTDFQKRCFVNEVLNIGSDPCNASPCQNNGHCFPKEGGQSRCICQDSYKGEKCQEGPCPSNDCQNDAYCKINDAHKTCVCKSGFTGGKCELKISEEKSEMSFEGTAKPRIFQCVIYQPCSMALLLTGDKHNVQRPYVSAGYVSPTIILNDIDVIDKGSSGSYQVNIGLKAKEVGVQDVCIQSMDQNGINKDELCFKVDVITEVSKIYGFKDRPHFIYPSLPNDARVECLENESCHVIYHITPGEGNDKECVSVKPTRNRGNETFHLFSSCEPCTPGQSNIGNCTVDISLISLGIGTVKRFCVAVSLIGSETAGEERCFNFTIISKTKDSEKKGCQLLECKNGGFCDGHVPEKPICYCKNGFAGVDCNEGVSKPSVVTSHLQSFVGDLSIPSTIKCTVDQKCSIQFQVVTAAGDHPDVSVGYSDPRLSTGELHYALPGSSNSMYMGSVDVHPTEEGSFHVCLQTSNHSKTVEELCVAVQVSGAPFEHTDMSKPHFVSPTLPRDSTVLCQDNRPCHLDLHFTNGDEFGFSGKCPSLTETGGNHITGIHVFTPVYQLRSCISDVTFTSEASLTQPLCLQIALPGKKGENRCYTITTVSNITKEVSSPCTGITCENGGKCIADLTSSPAKGTCVCALGFSGDNCNLAVIKSSGLPGIKNISSLTGISQHFDSKSGVPKNIKCDQVKPCCVVIPYFGDAAKPPLLGFKDSAITITPKQTVTPDSSRQDYNFLQTCFNGPPGETHRMCFQTTTNGTIQGMNVDEICFEAEFEIGGQSHSSMEPRFTNSLSNGSSVSCQPKTVCHIPVETDEKAGVCDQVKECGDGMPATHVFTTTKAGDKCITDVAIKTSEQHNTNKLCISAGAGGEKREIIVVTEKSEGFGPCQKIHCLNGGFCNSTSKTSAVCECASRFAGEICQNDMFTTSTTTTTASTMTTLKTVSTGQTTLSNPTLQPESLSTQSSTQLPSTATSTPVADVSSLSSSKYTEHSSDPTASTDVLLSSKASASNGNPPISSQAVQNPSTIPPPSSTSTAAAVASTSQSSARTTDLSTTLFMIQTVNSLGTDTTVSAVSSLSSSKYTEHSSDQTASTDILHSSKASASNGNPPISSLAVQNPSTIPPPSSTSTAAAVASTSQSSARTTDLPTTLPTIQTANSVAAGVKDQASSPTKLATSSSQSFISIGSSPTKASTTAVDSVRRASTVTALPQLARTLTSRASSAAHLRKASTTQSASTDGYHSSVSTVGTPEQCDNKKAKEHAKTMVKTGYASCFCMVRGKKVHVIKKRPVTQKKGLFKAAGFGAGGMVGTMVLGTVLYFIVNKVRQPAAGTRQAASTQEAASRRPAPSRRPPSLTKARVHPQSQPRTVQTKPELDF